MAFSFSYATGLLSAAYRLASLQFAQLLRVTSLDPFAYVDRIFESGRVLYNLERLHLLHDLELDLFGPKPPLKMNPTAASMSSPTVLDLVLVGAGHAHVHVLKMLAMNPIQGVRVTLVVPDLHTPYSGMLPGFVSGRYTFEEIHIDVWRLAALCRARLIVEPVVELDAADKTIATSNPRRPRIPYDVVSFDIGCVPSVPSSVSDPTLITPVKPISAFVQRFRELERLVAANADASSRFRIAIVGAGAGGVELAFALEWRFSTAVDVCLFGREPEPVPALNVAMRRRIAQLLAERGIRQRMGVEVVDVVQRSGSKCVVLADADAEDGDDIDPSFDHVLWVTSAA